MVSDTVTPEVTSVNIQSNSEVDGGYCGVGNSVTITFSVSEPIKDAFIGNTASRVLSNGGIFRLEKLTSDRGDFVYALTVDIDGSSINIHPTGMLILLSDGINRPFDLFPFGISDHSGNIRYVTSTTDGSLVRYRKYFPLFSFARSPHYG